MRIIRHLSDLPSAARGGVVALGNFDGVHRGHQTVIGEAGRLARAAEVPWLVATFEPHPRSVFTPDLPPFRLTPLRAKARLIEAMGVDDLLIFHFDEAFAAISAEQFVERILIDGLAVRHVVVGYDFHFGSRRRGTPELLAEMGAARGFGVTRIEAVEGGETAGAIISSTTIRDHLRAGHPTRASQLLGRPWEIEGRVAHGDARGRTIGFPTANLSLGEYLEPAHGVYAVRVAVDESHEHGEKRHAAPVWHAGVANLGRRPTFDGRDVLLEVHLLDFSGDLYDRHLRVAMAEFIRPEKKFDGLASLKAQIALDCETARRLLAEQERT